MAMGDASPVVECITDARREPMASAAMSRVCAKNMCESCEKVQWSDLIVQDVCMQSLMEVVCVR